MLLAFAVIFDPQYKLFFVRFALTKIYGEEEGKTKAEEVYNHLSKIFKEYQKGVGISEPNIVNDLTSDHQRPFFYDNLKEFEVYNPYDSSKNELDRYLDEPRMPISEDFCVLSFWKNNSATLPVLSSMARDILAIPITSFASESTFSMGGRILNKI